MVKKIKIVVSDLRLGVGRFLSDCTTNFLEEFLFDDKFSEFLEFYTKGKYADYDVEIILNGDILNFLQVSYKDHYITVVTEGVSLAKVKKIAEGHPKFFSALRNFASKEGCSITYIIGNSDQDVLWPRVQKYINKVLDTNVRYSNIVYHFDGVHVEHGHMYEEINKLDPRKFFLKKKLAEPILNIPFGSLFFLEFVLPIKKKHHYIDRVRPISRMIRWTLFNETGLALANSFKLVFFLLNAVFLKGIKKHWSWKKVLKIFMGAARLTELDDAAKKVLKNERVHSVVFGHTHVYQYRQFPDGKEYFNTGTWNELTSLDVVSLGKITKLTYVLFEYNEEESRPRGRLKEWKGYHRVEEDVAI